MESRLEDTMRRRAATQAGKLTIRAFSASHRFQGRGYCQPGMPRMSGRWWAMPLWQSMQVFSPLNRERLCATDAGGDFFVMCMDLRRGRPYASSPAADMLCLILSNFGVHIREPEPGQVIAATRGCPGGRR